MSVLVANRSEVALRVARSCDIMSIPVHGVYTDDDASSLHVKPGSIFHPSWIWLPKTQGIGFIGPSVDVLKLFGDKLQAKAYVKSLGIPVIDGTFKPTNLSEMEHFFRSLPKGSSIMIKAVCGGGGRGMRRVTKVHDLATSFERCQSEAKLSFGASEVYGEKLISRARHIEVQIVGDKSGNIISLGERECSIQRRHQKIIEVAPSPNLGNDLRLDVIEAAKTIARASSYVGIGTVEFLIEPEKGTFYFMEVNPRLQVEHTVTEELYGVDLVAIQLSIAKGATLVDLGLLHDPLLPTGYAIQCRINSETITADASAIPSSGTITVFEPCIGKNVRVDSAAYSGQKLTPHYDSMLAKTIIRFPSPDFQHAVDMMLRCLREFRIEGLATNISLLLNILSRPDVRDGFHVHTDYVLDHIHELIATKPLDKRFFQSSEVEVVGVKESKIWNDILSPGVVGVDSPLTGTLIALPAVSGSYVRKGTEIAVLLAMKMEHAVKAPFDGLIHTVCVNLNETVESGTPILFMKATEIDRDHHGNSSDSLQTSEPRQDLLEFQERQTKILDEHRKKAVDRRHAKGLRMARENIADLMEPGSFIEYGALAVAAQRTRREIDDLINSTPADGLVCGIGTVNTDGALNLQCAVFAYDFTVLAGTQGYWNHKKMDRLLGVVRRLELPVVGLFEGGGGRPGDSDSFNVSVAGLELETFRSLASLSGAVPLVGIAAGKVFAGNAALLGCCDVIIATVGSNIGMAGPAMIEGGGLGVFTPEEIGPSSVQTKNGVIDVLVKDEAEAIAVTKKYLSFFQKDKSTFICADQTILRNIVPLNRRRVYDVRQVVTILADTSSILELTKDYGPVGSGAVDTVGAIKLTRFLRICNNFGIPLISLCDTPGFLVGPKAEESGQVKAFGDLFVQFAKVKVPMFTVVLRKGTGLGAMAMAGGSFHASCFTISWPTGEFSGMGIDGAVRLAFKKELLAIKNEAARQKLFEEKVKELANHGKAINMASFLEIDAVIDPADSRSWVIRGLEMSRTCTMAPTRTSKREMAAVAKSSKTDAHKDVSPLHITYVDIDTPLGKITVAATEKGLCFLNYRDTPFKNQKIQLTSPPHPLSLTSWLGSLSSRKGLEGITLTETSLSPSSTDPIIIGTMLPPFPTKDPFAEVPVDFSIGLRSSSEFRLAIWKALRTVPVGCTWDYEELAAKCGKKGAARAAGTAVGLNPIPATSFIFPISPTPGLLEASLNMDQASAKLLFDNTDVALFPLLTDLLSSEASLGDLGLSDIR
ncbi:carbamoyl-phosphate synthase L chain, ATP binding domain-containing protein [Chytridium lagenaria]|nr:carbamoyl-phosphate synthase L chain, ATP binding domain-containing protein [Chytridium lagenaria]